jgi:RHS repeat-associated protein
MFRIRDEQASAMNSVTRGTLPDRILKSLHEKGLRAARDPASGAVVMSDARGNNSTLDFTTAGLPSEMVLPSGARFAFASDPDGRLSGITYPGGEQVSLGYDERGNIGSIESLGGPTHRMSYDDSDRLTCAEFPDDTVTKFYYGAAGLERTVDRTGAVTSYSSNEAAGTATIVDALGRTTTLIADARGGLQRILFPDGTEQRLVNGEGAGQALERRDRSVVRYEHDEEGTLEVIAWSDEERTKLRADKQSRVLTLENKTDRTELTFDDLRQPVREQTHAGAVDYRYDADGRLSELKNPWGDVVAHEYDGDGRLLSIRAWGGPECRFEYAVDGFVTAIKYGDKFVEHREAGPRGLLTRATLIDTVGDLLSDQHYSYDVCDRLTEMTDIWGQGEHEVEHRRFAHDAEGRLLAEIEPRSERVLCEYDYDLKGNLTYDAGIPISFGMMDEPVTRDGRAITYDLNGNALSFPARDGGELSCSWGPDGTLRQVSSGDLNVYFTYDALGRRISKTVGGQTWRYGWAGGLLLWEESSSHGFGEAVRRDYLYKPDGTPLAFRESGRTYWLQTDPRGAVIRALDEDGAVVWRARYESFGRALIEVALVRQPLRLAGQYEDEETGLHYNLARYYCPWIKSYLSLDPCWSSFGATNYSYAKNDPWNRIDRTGGLAFLAVFAVLAIAAVVAGVISAVGAYISGHGSILAAFVGGAITGLCTAAGGLLGSVFPVVGTAAGAIIGGAVGSFLGTLVEGAMNGEGWCWECALRAAVASVVLDLLTLGLSKIPFVKSFLQKASQQLEKLLIKQAEKEIEKQTEKDIEKQIEKEIEKPLLRRQYEDAVGALKNKVDALRQAGKSAEDIARELHADRRALGEQFKALTPSEKLAEIHERNLIKYGDKLGPSIDWLRQHGKSWEEIIESATRPGGKDLKF